MPGLGLDDRREPWQGSRGKVDGCKTQNTIARGQKRGTETGVAENDGKEEAKRKTGKDQDERYVPYAKRKVDRPWCILVLKEGTREDGESGGEI